MLTTLHKGVFWIGKGDARQRNHPPPQALGARITPRPLRRPSGQAGRWQLLVHGCKPSWMVLLVRYRVEDEGDQTEKERIWG